MTGVGRGPRRRSPRRSSGSARRIAAAGGQRDPQGGHGFLRRGTRPPQPLIRAFIADQAAEGRRVESICRVLREQGCRSPRGPTGSGSGPRSRSLPAPSPTRRCSTRCATPPGPPGPDGQRKLAPEGLYGRRTMTAHLRRTARPRCQCRRGGPRDAPDQSQRRRRPLHVAAVHRAPRVGGHRTVDRVRRGRLRQRADGVRSSGCSRPSACAPIFHDSPFRPSATSSTQSPVGSTGRTTTASTAASGVITPSEVEQAYYAALVPEAHMKPAQNLGRFSQSWMRETALDDLRAVIAELEFARAVRLDGDDQVITPAGGFSIISGRSGAGGEVALDAETVVVGRDRQVGGVELGVFDAARSRPRRGPREPRWQNSSTSGVRARRPVRRRRRRGSAPDS